MFTNCSAVFSRNTSYSLVIVTFSAHLLYSFQSGNATKTSLVSSEPTPNTLRHQPSSYEIRISCKNDQNLVSHTNLHCSGVQIVQICTVATLYTLQVYKVADLPFLHLNFKIHHF